MFRFVVPESPRWLLCKGRVSEVKEVLRAAARFNGRQLPDNLDKYLKVPCNEDQESGVGELFRTKYLRLVTFCFLCIWFTMVSDDEGTFFLITQLLSLLINTESCLLRPSTEHE